MADRTTTDAVEARAPGHDEVPTLKQATRWLGKFSNQDEVASTTPRKIASELAGIHSLLLSLATAEAASGAGERGRRYLADRFQWAAPGDQQEDAWIVRFCDNDVRDMLFTGPDAEREAWEAWEQHAPGYNMFVFRLASLPPATDPAMAAPADWVNSIAGVKPTDQFIALDRRLFEDCIARALAAAPTA